MGILATLYRLARSGKSHEEDALTEILRHLLEEDHEVLREFVKALRFPRRTGIPSSRRGGPTVQTQVSEPDPFGGHCRYDLLFTWPTGVRLIVEVKVGAGLTMKAVLDADGEAEAVDQLHRYLALARGEPMTFVASLGIRTVDLPGSVTDDERFIGALSWQQLHDFVWRVLDRDPTDPSSTLRREWVDLLEETKLATAPLTFEGLTSVYKYNVFHEAFGEALNAAVDRIAEEGLLEPFERPTDSKWQEAYERIGYRLFVDRDRSRMAFVGLWHGDGTVHHEIPDLYFFYEVAKDSSAAKFIDGRAAEIVTMLDALETPSGGKWSFEPGGYQTIQCATSMVEVVRQPDPAEAIADFFVGCLRASGPRQVFFQALEQ
ncbi:MAG: hypothetical protein RMA76_09305 [Deltaproteobacteria bacterium]